MGLRDLFGGTPDGIEATDTGMIEIHEGRDGQTASAMPLAAFGMAGADADVDGDPILILMIGADCNCHDCGPHGGVLEFPGLAVTASQAVDLAETLIRFARKRVQEYPDGE